MKTLDTLTALGPELTTEQLDEATGGMLLLIILGVVGVSAAVGFAVGYVYGSVDQAQSDQQQCTCP